eukprot:TRINITY_DN57163_c0_g1_i1.p1 TRINITY_DN57163_c0_g1~~TRINITY_DN57163_c0_g1_i1.p1  ORF type:complete len:473 (-),score=54.21 TRINITY_DN57163_c0_g1_i1:293-1711(-)
MPSLQPVCSTGASHVTLILFVLHYLDRCSASVSPLLQSTNTPPDSAAVLRFAAAPFLDRWVSGPSLDELGSPNCPCALSLIMLDWLAQCVQKDFGLARDDAHAWQDHLAVSALEGRHTLDFLTSAEFQSLFQPVIRVNRLCEQTMDFVSALSFVQGRRCFHLELRDKLAVLVHLLSKLSEVVRRMQLATVYMNIYSFKDATTDLYDHIAPVWDAISLAAEFAGAFTEVRYEISRVFVEVRETDGPWALSQSAWTWHDSTGAFSAMNFLTRELTDGWHLDHGLIAWLLRRLPAPPDWKGPGTREEGGLVVPQKQGAFPPQQVAIGCHTSIVDFGAGGGHYCKFLNQTGEYCCFAFDGAPHAGEFTDGRVQTQRLDVPFDLGRTFDWVMCLEVAEHIPREFEDVLLQNLRRHARRGLILSWSEEGSEVHPNPRPWQEVRQAVEATGFAYEEGATSGLWPRVSWLKGQVRVFLAI